MWFHNNDYNLKFTFAHTILYKKQLYGLQIHIYESANYKALVIVYKIGSNKFVYVFIATR